MPQLRIVNIAILCLIMLRENKILTKKSEFAVFTLNIWTFTSEQTAVSLAKVNNMSESFQDYS